MYVYETPSITECKNISCLLLKCVCKIYYTDSILRKVSPGGEFTSRLRKLKPRTVNLGPTFFTSCGNGSIFIPISPTGSRVQPVIGAKSIVYRTIYPIPGNFYYKTEKTQYLKCQARESNPGHVMNTGPPNHRDDITECKLPKFIVY